MINVNFEQYRNFINEINPPVEYSLTEKRKMLYPIFVAIGNWCQQYGNDKNI